MTTEPFLESLSLLARLARIKAAAAVVAERARSSRLRLEKDIKNTKAGAPTPAREETT